MGGSSSENPAEPVNLMQQHCVECDVWPVEKARFTTDFCFLKDLCAVVFVCAIENWSLRHLD